MELSEDQARAEEQFKAFMNSDATAMTLLGFGGTGKTTMMSRLLAASITPYLNPVFLTPTRKALSVGLAKLESDPNLDIELVDIGSVSPKRGPNPGALVYGTTAQMLGLRPVIVEDQNERDTNFGMASEGALRKVPDVGLIVIDECSMLSTDAVAAAISIAQNVDTKILFMGDPGQLPPVKQRPHDWLTMPNTAVLTQIMRQQGDSAIPLVADAIRRNADWRAVHGPGVAHVDDVAGVFLSEVTAPTLDETQRSVFIAYHNAIVDSVQAACCEEVYGHGHLDLQVGETIVATRPMYEGQRLLCANGESLLVTDMLGDGEWGPTAVFERSDGGRFAAEYIPAETLQDRHHPYVKETARRLSVAKKTQADYRKRRVDRGTQAKAWRDYFALEKDAVLGFAHCFAITSHKSQGSTYARAYVDASDLEVSPQGLYVAASRPSTELIIG